MFSTKDGLLALTAVNVPAMTSMTRKYGCNVLQPFIVSDTSRFANDEPCATATPIESLPVVLSKVTLEKLEKAVLGFVKASVPSASSETSSLF